jgi:hypothetical protein
MRFMWLSGKKTVIFSVYGINCSGFINHKECVSFAVRAESLNVNQENCSVLSLQLNTNVIERANGQSLDNFKQINSPLDIKHQWTE